MSERLTDLFADALEIADAAERSAFLERECDGDAALRREVEELLAAGSQVAPDSGFLSGGAAANMAPPEEQAGRYRLREKLGEGGWGVVYRAEQTEPVRREVALKIIRPGMDSRQVLARFAAERQALALMDHPHIARVLDAGATEAGRPYFVMELVRGPRITDFCDKRRLTVPQRLELFVKVPWTNGQWLPVAISFVNGGVDVDFNGQAVFRGVTTPGFELRPGDRFGFGGRVGGSNQISRVDNVSLHPR